MRVNGYCEKCKKFKTVHVSSSQVAVAAARPAGKRVFTGVCTPCEEESK